MTIKEIEKGTLLVSPGGELDHHIASKFRASIDKKLTEDVNNIIFDFSDLTFMDSSGIGMIMGRYKKVKKLGGKIIIANASPQIKRIIKMAGLDAIVLLSSCVKRAVKKI